MDRQWTWRENQARAPRLHAAKLKAPSVEDIDYALHEDSTKAWSVPLGQKSVWAANHENVFVLGPTVLTPV